MRLEVHAIALCSSACVLSVYFLSNSDTYHTHTHMHIHTTHIHTNTPHTHTQTHHTHKHSHTHTNTLSHFSGFSFGFCINEEDGYRIAPNFRGTIFS